MATTQPKPDPTGIPTEKQETDKPKKIGGPKDFVILDESGQPIEALPPDDDKIQPFRLEHDGVLYERAGTDEDGRATYRKSV